MEVRWVDGYLSAGLWEKTETPEKKARADYCKSHGGKLASLSSGFRLPKSDVRLRMRRPSLV